LQCGKGKRPPGQKSWPAIQGAVIGFSVKKGEKGLLDRNHGLQFKGLGWGFQCKKGPKKAYWTEIMACNSRGWAGVLV